MNYSFEEFFELLNTQQNNFWVAVCFLGICAVAIVFRIIVCIGYQSAFAYYKLNAKELKSKADFKRGKRFGLLNKAVDDYIKVAEKNVSTINTKSIVNKYILRLNFIGWSYSGIEHFVTGVEQGSVFIGLILSLIFPDYKFIYGIISVGVFILMRLLASIFDFRLTREKLLEEITEYIDREIGQFYAGDLSSVILRFKNDISNASLEQTKILSNSVDKLGKDLTGMLQLSIQEMTSNLDKSLDKIGSYGDIIKKPIEDWAGTLKTAAELQVRINSAAANMEAAVVKLNSSSENINLSFQSLGKNLIDQSASIKEQINVLVSVVNGINETGVKLINNNDAIEKQLKYIERNQNALETSLQQYETTLETITQKIGTGFGSIVEFHMQSSYNSLNENLNKNLNKIINSNNELINRLQELFDTMREQSRSETQAILRIKEQMDIHFDS